MNSTIWRNIKNYLNKMQNELIQKLKNIIIEKSKDKSFLHNDWFVDYHLSIVEKIALELCGIYKEADKNLVLVLVWIHDYGKILDMKNQHDLNYKSKELLVGIGFDEDFIEKAMDYLDLMERKMEIDLKQAPIEVKIVSSADGASHFVGPFMHIYWKEYNNKNIAELLDDNIKKINKDWDNKIVLPEIKEKFLDRYLILKEQSGTLPEKFL